jgi:hypothetical protein
MLLAFLFNALLVAIAVLIHFEVLTLLSVYTPKLNISRRLSILIGILGALCAHLMEVWLFAIGFYVLLKMNTMGDLTGATDRSFIDCLYFSISSYTSLGVGDIAPTGWVRFLAGMEALTGLVLIAWTASFMFLEMQKHWKIK